VTHHTLNLLPNLFFPKINTDNWVSDNWSFTVCIFCILWIDYNGTNIVEKCYGYYLLPESWRCSWFVFLLWERLILPECWRRVSLALLLPR
jgi:hypothetical protein